MWVTPDGVQHVLSLPDPGEVLTPEALDSFRSLMIRVDADTLGLLLDDRLLALSDAGFAPDPDAAFLERAPDVGLLDGDLSTVEGLDAALSRIDPRWQVDLIVALHSMQALHALHTLLDPVDEEMP